MENEENKNQTDLEWKQRILCSDESCIGVIGPDGRCKECGLPYAGGPAENIEQTPTDSDFEEAVEDEDADEDMEEFSADEDAEDFSEDEDAEEFSADEDAEDFSEDEDAETITDLEWDQRILCSDESCIGVIGPDGRCKECGKPYDSK